MDICYLRAMQYMKWLAIAVTLVLLLACWYPWVTIESKNIIITGFHTEGTKFGKPGIFHYFLSVLFIIFILINRVWSLRTAFFIGAFNIAWAVRNFILISTCSGGICPEKQPALYIVLFTSILATIAALFVNPPQPEQLKA